MFRSFMFSLAAFALQTQLVISVSDANGFRYWYDESCTYRVAAGLIKVSGGSVILTHGGDKPIAVPVSALYLSDRAFVAAYAESLKAIPYLDRSPYASADRSLGRLERELAREGVATEEAKEMAMSKNVMNHRIEQKLLGRWLDISGLQYQILSCRVSPDVTGFEELVVRKEQTCGPPYTVRPPEVQSIKILPQFWNEVTYRLGTHPDTPFARRGVPSQPFLGLEDRWKDTLVYDPVYAVWTDPESAKAHAHLKKARMYWAEARRLEFIACARWHVHRGKSMLACRDPSAASKEFTAAIKNAPNYVDAYLQRALAYHELRRNGDALPDLGRAIDHGHQQQQEGFQRLDLLLASYEKRARIRSEERMHDEAISDARQAVELNPNKDDRRYEGLVFTVRMAAATDMAQNAESTLAAFDRDAKLADADFETAIGFAQKAIAYNPDESVGRFAELEHRCRQKFALFSSRQAESLLAAKDFEAAINYARKAVERNPDAGNDAYSQLVARCMEAAADHFSTLAQDDLRSRRYAAAVEHVETAIRLGPADRKAELDDFLAKCCLERAIHVAIPGRNWRMARDDLTKYLSKDPNHADALFLRSQALCELADMHGAVRDVGKSIEIGGKTDEKLRVRAIAWEGIGRYREAISDLNELIANSPQDASLYGMRGRIQYVQGQFDLAVSDARKAIDLDGTCGDYHLLLAEAYLRKGDYDAAQNAVNSARNAGARYSQIDSVAARIERGRREDPYFFDKDEWPAAALALAASGMQAYFADKFAEDAANAKSFGDFFANALGVGTLTVTKSWTDAAAIDAVFPNLPETERSALISFTSELVTATVNSLFRGEKFSISGVVLGGVEGFTKDKLKEALLARCSDSPEQFLVHAGDLLFETCRQIQSKMGDKSQLTSSTQPNNL